MSGKNTKDKGVDALAVYLSKVIDEITYPENRMLVKIKELIEKTLKTGGSFPKRVDVCKMLGIGKGAYARRLNILIKAGKIKSFGNNQNRIYVPVDMLKSLNLEKYLKDSDDV